MAKKSRRARRKATKNGQTVLTSRPVRPQATAAPKEVDYFAEYSYVIADLKRIGIIALGLLLLLIALAFIIS